MPTAPELHDLPPKWARLCLDVEGFLQTELCLELQGKKLVVGVSGGVDSTALLLVVRAMSSRWQVEPMAVHLNHRLRPEAGAEAAGVERLCRNLGVPCYAGSSRVDIFAARRGLGIEEAGRQLRYRLLFGLRRRQGAAYVLTAHQLNDLAEDCIMRQLRGAGWPALGGMTAYESKTGLLRPLLLTPKATLAELVSDLGYSWSEDSSNQELNRLRNRVRWSILPLYLQENPGFLESVARMWRQAELDRDFWASTLSRLSAGEEATEGTLLLRNAWLAAEHKAVRLRWYRDVLSRLGQGQALAETLHRLDAAWLTKVRGKTLQFPGGKRARVEQSGIRFFPAGAS
jgi:tRNA(Ile)-lysidine synthase